MAAGRQAHPLKGALHQPLAGGIQRAELRDHGRGHVSVAGHACPGEAGGLNGPRRVYPSLYLCGGFRRGFAPHGLVLYGGNVDVQVNAVQQGTGDLFRILCHFTVRAGAFSGGVAPPAAAAGVHGAHQLEPGRKVQGAARAGHGHLAVLQRLPHGLQHIPVEFRQLVQKQHAVVGKGDLTGPHGRAAARQRRGRGGVVRAAEGTADQKGMTGICQTGHRPDAGDCQSFLPAHVGQDGGQTLGQHGFARARASDEE